MTAWQLHAFDQSLPAAYGMAERLSPRIERVLAPNPSPFTFRGTGVYLVGDARHVAVIDPGPDLPEHLAALMAAIGGAQRDAYSGHPHPSRSFAGRRAAEGRTGAKTYGYGPHARYPDDVEEGGDRDFVPDVAVRDGEVIAGEGFTFHCVFTPGHTSNHMCYALEEEKALFTGDHVMGWSTTVMAPPDGDMGDYMRSLEKLIARAGPHSLSHPWLAHRRSRDPSCAPISPTGGCAKPRSGVPGARPATRCRRLVAALMPGLTPALHRAAALTVEAHLKHMLEGRPRGAAGWALLGIERRRDRSSSGPDCGRNRARPVSLCARMSKRAPMVPAARTRITMSVTWPNQKLVAVASMRPSFSL